MKNLFSKTLSKKKLVIFSASFLVFVAALGIFMYEGTKNTVALTLDGQERVIKTHANTIQDLFNDLDISLRSEDYLSLAVNTKVKDNLSIVWKPAKQVEVIQDQEKKTYWTAADTVKDFLKEQNIVVSEHDKLNLNPDAKLKKDMKIAIQRAFSLKLVVGGKEQDVWSTSTTVADFLSQQGITLNELDRVEPEQKQTVTKDDVINVIRVEKVTDVVEEPINFAVITKNDSNLEKGKQKVVSQGQEGLLSKHYEVILENGKEVSRKLVSEKKVKEKQDKVVAMGTKVIVAQVSRGTSEPAGKEFYVTSTAYTANCSGCSGRTATGINLRANPNIKVIAVDPSVIPLGTKVYVEGYGYAIAADKGSAVKGYKIDVFFPSTSDAYRWGRKRVKIKILN
ncbi:ubiquitin-like domain-containing protein [Mesobacillus subterraneus]|uniref:G5 and 3D domain-containing protein n=1 Tax=Mesobacillus subterraneus TaxID=285983 RepID=UPI00203F6E0E|nr:G5 and 3D domain-containing protein [Mesobacillus subterraneus]MCM3667117.1 ubiquitin-like domain-containing protein [Mesobacillus subterraneus]MCM3685865.1 ubiquitin-like domain-containing protein [Mesobacillus subterraneus]